MPTSYQSLDLPVTVYATENQQEILNSNPTNYIPMNFSTNYSGTNLNSYIGDVGNMAFNSGTSAITSSNPFLPAAPNTNIDMMLNPHANAQMSRVEPYNPQVVNGSNAASYSPSVLGNFQNPTLSGNSAAGYNPADMSNFYGNSKKEDNVGMGDAMNSWQKFNLAMQGLGGLAQAYTGLEELNQRKEEFKLNTYNQAQQINTQLEDRQRARLAASGGSGYASLNTYMDNNRVRSA